MIKTHLYEFFTERMCIRAELFDALSVNKWIRFILKIKLNYELKKSLFILRQRQIYGTPIILSRKLLIWIKNDIFCWVK